MAVKELQFSLLSDGPSDKALMPIITWLLRQHFPDCAIQSRWADLRRLRQPPRQLHERIQEALKLYPCDLLFVHRDAEKISYAERMVEIDKAVHNVHPDSEWPVIVGVVPVRMMEAWLLFDEKAIRWAAGNPNGSEPLSLSRLTDVEHIPDPKRTLHDIILDVTGLGTRRRKHFDVSAAVQRVSECIDDFSPLRLLSAFAALEDRVAKTIEQR